MGLIFIDFYWFSWTKNHWKSMVFMWPSLDFHGFSISTSTSGNSSSDFRTSLRMLGYVFISPSERSRDLEGYYTGRVAARGRIKSSKVGCFAFWAILAIRRWHCVRPYQMWRYFSDYSDWTVLISFDQIWSDLRKLPKTRNVDISELVLTNFR